MNHSGICFPLCGHKLPWSIILLSKNLNSYRETSFLRGVHLLIPRAPPHHKEMPYLSASPRGWPPCELRLSSLPHRNWWSLQAIVYTEGIRRRIAQLRALLRNGCDETKRDIKAKFYRYNHGIFLGCSTNSTYLYYTYTIFGFLQNYLNSPKYHNMYFTEFFLAFLVAKKLCLSWSTSCPKPEIMVCKAKWGL